MIENNIVSLLRSWMKYQKPKINAESSVSTFILQEPVSECLKSLQVKTHPTVQCCTTMFL